MSYGEFFDHKSSFLFSEVVSQGVMCLSRLLHDFPVNVVLVCFISFPVNNNISNSANGNFVHAHILEVFSCGVARNTLDNLHFFHVKYVQLYLLEVAFVFINTQEWYEIDCLVHVENSFSDDTEVTEMWISVCLLCNIMSHIKVFHLFYFTDFFDGVNLGLVMHQVTRWHSLYVKALYLFYSLLGEECDFLFQLEDEYIVFKSPYILNKLQFVSLGIFF